MPSIDELNPVPIIDDGPTVALMPCQLRQSRQHIERGNGGSRFLDRRRFLNRRGADLLKNLKLKRIGPSLRAEDLVLHLLQLGSHEPLAVGDGLLANVILWRLVEIRSC